MNYRKMGRTGLNISEISLGSWLTYGNSTDKEIATKVIDTAYSLGINYFDTANVYANGKAEVIVGEALKKYPRESYVLATKAFWPMGTGPNDKGLSRKHVFEQVHASLKRLNVNYIDLFYCHRYDPETPLEETLRTIDDLLRQGKILYVGVSEWTATQMAQALHIADRYLLDRIVVNQPQYSMLYRYIEEEVIPFGEKNGISQVVFSPLAQGVLTGKYKPGGNIPSDSRAADPNSNMFMDNLLKEEKLLKVEKLKTLADELGISLSQLAIAWVLRHPNISSALIGASKPEQVEENVKASGIKLSDEVLDKIEAILE
ncbi:aldo/keto reductase family protein [Acetivibrio mesophilus]|uniref:Aldo/keto reductase n=1 Tax=Acetivibrio mesophilus TaxID=2487273 RepID=A0A4Q0I967_9FIRM|nr:aldo/keto reductase family protein [Acetivibrio mesophilus]RXE59542.1 aldo/keto reductase [Acetivibrio mesophilus]